MKTAVNELRKCNMEGNKWKLSGSPQEGAERPSSMRPPELGDLWPAKTWIRADHFSSFFLFKSRLYISEKAFFKCAYVHIDQALQK